MAEIIGQSKCRECGLPVRLKVNSNGTVYYYCDGAIAPGMCSHHEKWGPWKSRAIVEKLKAPLIVKDEKKEPANVGTGIDAAPAGQQEQPAAVATGKPTGKRERIPTAFG